MTAVTDTITKMTDTTNTTPNAISNANTVPTANRVSTEPTPAIPAVTVTAAEERRFLILDDNDANRLLLKFAVQSVQATYIEAATAQQAIDLCKPGQASFAFLDIELPDFSGLEVARRLRQGDDRLAIIMCSTNDDPLTITKAVEMGCDMFVVKPFQLDMLMELMKVIDRATLRSAPEVLIVENTSRRRFQPRTSATNTTNETTSATNADAPVATATTPA